MLDVVPEMGGQIELNQHFNQQYLDQRFEIIGTRIRGIHGYVCALKRVEV